MAENTNQIQQEKRDEEHSPHVDDASTDDKQTENNADGQEDGEEKKPVLLEKGELSEFVKTALLAVLFALLIRSVIFEPFNIPSSSMKPSLLVGDYLFVNKPAYGYSRYSFPFGIAPIEGRIWSGEPTRGDVIVFALPSAPSISYIKRVVAMPGETVQVRRGRLYINSNLVEREFIASHEVIDDNGRMQKLSEYEETLPNGIKHKIYENSDFEQLDNTPVFTVPENHYFVMGDNRDNSQDSRVPELVGPIPYENIVGRADFLFFSTNGYARFFEIWKWPQSIRYDRLFMDIDPEPPQTQ